MIFENIVKKVLAKFRVALFKCDELLEEIMLSIFEKTQDEMEEEKEFNKYCEGGKKGIIKDVCPFYIVSKDKTKVDVLDLSEEQIIHLYRQSLREYIIARSNHEMDSNGMIESTYDAFKLTEGLKGKRTVSYEGLKQILELFSPDFLTKYERPMMDFSLSQSEKEVYKIIAKKLLTPFVNEKMNKVETIAKYLKESKGDFENVSDEMKYEVINQLIINEQSRKVYRQTEVQEHCYH